MNTKETRIREIDIVKGIVILFVVIGHGYSGWTNIGVLINGFHVPFFFIISGIIYGQKECDFRFDFWRKVKTLIAPYFFYEVLWLLFIGLLNIKNNNWNAIEIVKRTFLFKGNFATWYLPCTFGAEFIFWIALHTHKLKCYIIVIGFALGLIVPTYLNSNGIVLSRVLVGMGFFAIGYFGYDFFRIKYCKSVYMILTVIYGIITIKNGLIKFFIGEYGNIILFVISSVIGSYLILRFCDGITYVARECKGFDRICLYLSYWGRSSLTIMCIHMFVIEMIRIIDYKFFNNSLPKFGACEGIFIGGICMICCDIVLFATKYFHLKYGGKFFIPNHN